MNAKSYYQPFQPKNQQARWVIWVTLIAFITLVVWSSMAKIDQVTRASGSVIASDRTQEIQALEGGIITTLTVKEGDNVKKGQLLVILEEERAKAAVDNSATKIAALQAKVSRLEAELFNRPLKFSPSLDAYPEYIANQTALYNRRRQAIEQDIRSLEAILRLAQQELNMNEPLLEYGDVSQADVIRLRRQVADIQSQIANKRNKYFEEAQNDLTKTQEELESEQEQMRDRTQVLQEKRLIAPTDGKVNNIKITTLGGVVKPGEVVMQILPTNSSLIVEVKVKPTDIADVSIGQKANIKLDAYDYSIYGTLDGVVSYISPDSLMQSTPRGEEPYYRVQIKIIGTEFKDRQQKIQVKPGMTVNVDIKAKQRTVLSYLTKPITKTISESMGER
ncbi:HlyD family type I secretion periplasmic adaptor subunit [Moraxella osloensis]|uniref:Membrane fusion protein (MFP) family protein n=1 Tax=Faucicola osloensis TaxID=34062 RepID=A0A2D2LXT2_FAUOS|nr:HlyD family type I secretion periplasmic adaptor subunit [Moraxella osloensis]ATR79845.1 secretion protein [Moraxella osloensis]